MILIQIICQKLIIRICFPSLNKYSYKDCDNVILLLHSKLVTDNKDCILFSQLVFAAVVTAVMLSLLQQQLLATAATFAAGMAIPGRSFLLNRVKSSAAGQGFCYVLKMFMV